MKNVFSRAFAIILALTLCASCLVGCEPSGAPQKSLNILTWEGYIPQSVLDGFSEKTGIRVNLSSFESNEEMLTKLEATGAKDYDIVIASDYIIDIARKQDLLAELDVSLIANWKNIDPIYQSQYYDPENKYTVPYAVGTPLIVYDRETVGFEITGYEDLWRPELADSLALLDDGRNIIGITLKTLGKSFNETDPAVLQQAKEKLLALKPNVRALDYNTPNNAVVSGEASVGYMFTPQVVQALADKPELSVCYPKEGMGFGIDSLFVPKYAPNLAAAHEFLNYVLDGKVGAAISEEILYLCPNSASKDFLSDNYKNNSCLYIPSEILGDTEFIQDVGDATELFSQIWTEFKQK